MAYTITSTGFTALFWWMVARYYAVDEVGLTIVLISMAQLLTTTANLGMNFSLIRFYQASKDKRGMLNTVITICFVGGAILGALTILIGPRLSHSLVVLNRDLAMAGIFLAAVILLALFQLSYPILTAMDKLGTYFALNVFVLIGRLILLLLLSGGGGHLMLMCIFVFPLFLADIYILAIFLSRALPGFYPRLIIQREVWTKIGGYSIATYFGNILHDLPYQLLPQVVANSGGFADASYFYFPWSLFGLIVTMSNSVSYSLFVEGSNRPDSFQKNLGKATLATWGIASIAAFAFFFLSYPLLSLFGLDYAIHGSQVLKILCLAAIPASFVYNRVAVLRVRKNVLAIIFIYGLIACTCFFLAYANPLLHNILWLGISWLVTQIIAAFVMRFLADGKKNTGYAPS
jgi:O-antigen/teichoic acid export membrane protein